MRVRMLGGFEVSVGVATVAEVAWRLRKAAALVKLLALAPGRWMHRGRAADLLRSELDARAQAAPYPSHARVSSDSSKGFDACALRD